jgi:DHA3 family tetracycline resistance protein-like MFS transporter
LVSTQFEIQQPVEGTGGWRVLAPFRFREYRQLIGALSISIFAEGMWAVVMALQVIALVDNPASLSLVATCLGAGLVALVLVGGIAAAFFFPAYSAMLPRILPADQLLAANGVEGVARPVFQRAVGPAVAGVLVSVTFPALGAFAVAGLFAVGLVLLVATRPAKAVAPQHDQPRPHVLRDMRDGFRFMVWTPWLLWTFAVREHLRAGGARPDRGAVAVHRPRPVRGRRPDVRLHPGGLRGRQRDRRADGLVRRPPRRYLTVMMVMCGAGSLPLVIVGWTSSFPLMALATFIVGVTDGTGSVIWGTLLQRRVPREMLGRVSSLDFFVSLAFMPVSFAIAGPLSKVVSMQTIFLAAGIVPVVLAAIAMIAARMPRDEILNPLR